MAHTAPLSGRNIGRFKLLMPLSEGAFGQVYQAHDTLLQRDVAIKVADSELTRVPQLREAFLKEARIQSHLEHAGIVPIYDVQETEQCLCIVMRMVRGESLEQSLHRRERPYEPAEALDLLRQALLAVGFAHEQGVIHQDLKPGNILLTRDGEALVLDFGIARRVGEQPAFPSSATGTPAYMAPEQVSGLYTDARTDIYALGMTLYEMLTLHHPFEQAADREQVMQWQRERLPSPPYHFNAALPADLSHALLKALEKEPRKRYRSCAEFVTALEETLGVQGVPRASDSRWDPRAGITGEAGVRTPDGHVFQATVLDLSVGGAALRAPVLIGMGESVAIELNLDDRDTGRLIRARAIIMWAHPEKDRETAMMGMRFTEMPDADRTWLGDRIREALVLGKGLVRKIDKRRNTSQPTE